MTEPTPTLATQAEFAAQLGHHKAYVTRLKQAGRLVMLDGKVDVEKSLALIAATADPSRREAVVQRAARSARAGQASGGALPPPADIPVEAGIPPADETQPGTRAYYHRLALQYDNSIKKILLALKRRTRYRVEAVEREPRGVGEMPRAGIERMIDQVASRMTVVRDDNLRRELIAFEVRRIRRAVKKEAVRAMRRMGESGAEKSA